MLDLNDPRSEIVSILCPECGAIIDHVLTTDVECSCCDFEAEEDSIDWDAAIEAYNQWLTEFLEGGRRD